ncbi:glycoside hydrolase family 15 protein [Lentinula detonsa]|uniref:Glucoamylase n=1 Tax=Lentinula detonsa TaxID=2804962 RepID=A0A9W8P618_9AGAR|nr:glycoside hydrolase family 15 protein [Lentinula detonsa]
MSFTTERPFLGGGYPQASILKKTAVSLTYLLGIVTFIPIVGQLANAVHTSTGSNIRRHSSLSGMMMSYSQTYMLSSSANDYIQREGPLARTGLLANIGPKGSQASGAKPGIVVASPSTSNPDYLYSWTRDSALVFKTIVDHYISSSHKNVSLRVLIDDYAHAQTQLQEVGNPSGNITTGGLGEPKFNIDLTAFEGSWGRPQRDGPALRAITLITYVNWLLDNSNTSHANTLWPTIQLDLDYVANDWNKTGFDLWEEVSSSSFWTTASQHRALRQGAALAKSLGKEDLNEKYNIQADNALCFLQSYWNPDASYVTSNTGGGRSGIDANSVLTSIHTFDPSAGCDAITFQPCSDKALSNLKVYVDSFRSIYAINQGFAENEAVATGRYPEDVYMGGNPWYLATFAVAEQLYESLSVWDAQGSLQITSISLPFFQQFSSDVQTGDYKSNTETYDKLTSEIRAFADGFIAINGRYTPDNGSLAEQYNKDDGKPTSARDLTWSYASAITAFLAHDGIVASPWGAQGLQIQTDSDGHCIANPGPMSEIVFKVEKDTVYGENVFITGSIGQLGNWDPAHAVKLDPKSYPYWSVEIEVPASISFSYKYIIQNQNSGSVAWENDPNHELQSSSEGQSMVVTDTWHN